MTGKLRRRSTRRTCQFKVRIPAVIPVSGLYQGRC
jgi:hypothetical protein